MWRSCGSTDGSRISEPKEGEVDGQKGKQEELNPAEEVYADSQEHGVLPEAFRRGDGLDSQENPKRDKCHQGCERRYTKLYQELHVRLLLLPVSYIRQLQSQHSFARFFSMRKLYPLCCFRQRFFNISRPLYKQDVFGIIDYFAKSQRT